MAKTYEFTVDVKVDGDKFKAGAFVSENDLPAGCLQSLKQTGRVVPVSDERAKARAAEMKAAAEARDKAKLDKAVADQKLKDRQEKLAAAEGEARAKLEKQFEAEDKAEADAKAKAKAANK